MNFFTRIKNNIVGMFNTFLSKIKVKKHIKKTTPEQRIEEEKKKSWKVELRIGHSGYVRGRYLHEEARLLKYYRIKPQKKWIHKEWLLLRETWNNRNYTEVYIGEFPSIEIPSQEIRTIDKKEQTLEYLERKTWDTFEK